MLIGRPRSPTLRMRAQGTPERGPMMTLCPPFFCPRHGNHTPTEPTVVRTVTDIQTEPHSGAQPGPANLPTCERGQMGVV